MKTLYFAEKHIVKNGRKVAHRIPLYIDDFDDSDEFTEDFDDTTENDKEAEREAQFKILRKQGYQIFRTRYEQAFSTVTTNITKPPHYEIHPTDSLISFINTSVANETTYSILSVPESKRKHAKQGYHLNPLYWLKKAASLLANKMFGGLLGRIILKAQTTHFKFKGKTPDERTTEFIQENAEHITAERIKLFTHRKNRQSELDTLELSLKSAQDARKEDTLYIIKVVGYDMCYQQRLEEMKDDLLKLADENINAHVIGFNFSNVVDSIGRVKSKKDLAADLDAQVQRLINEGVPAKNIVVKGYSLGAGISAETVAREHHKKDQATNLFHDRSFKRLSSAVAGWIRTGKKSGHKSQNVAAAIFAPIAEPFIRFGLWLAKWEINAENAYAKIPDDNKEYIVVKTKTRDLTPHTTDDKTIAHSASLHKSSQLKQLRGPKEGEERIRTPSRKMTVMNKENNTSSRNGHTVPMDALINREGQTASQFFRQFAVKVFNQGHDNAPENNEGKEKENNSRYTFKG